MQIRTGSLAASRSHPLFSNLRCDIPLLEIQTGYPRAGQDAVLSRVAGTVYGYRRQKRKAAGTEGPISPPTTFREIHRAHDASHASPGSQLGTSTPDPGGFRAAYVRRPPTHPWQDGPRAETDRALAARRPSPTEVHTRLAAPAGPLAQHPLPPERAAARPFARFPHAGRDSRVYAGHAAFAPRQASHDGGPC